MATPGKSRDLPSPKPAWFIVNMCGGRWNDTVIHRTRKPTQVFTSLTDAYSAATQLADEHTHGDYAIFECIGRVKSSKRKDADGPRK